MLLIGLTYGPVLFAMLFAIVITEIREVKQKSEGSKMSLALSLLLIIGVAAVLFSPMY
jgi:hypothetical protein